MDIRQYTASTHN